MQDRIHHQRHVDTLLNQLEEQRHRASVLRWGGVQPAGMRDLKADIRAVRVELATAVGTAASF
jgi:hypothetical protein